jgi:hypothetical protein
MSTREKSRVVTRREWLSLLCTKGTQPNALRFVPERLLALKEETEHLSSDTVFHDP